MYEKTREDDISRAKNSQLGTLPPKHRQKLQQISGLDKKLEGSMKFEDLSFFHIYGSTRYDQKK